MRRRLTCRRVKPESLQANGALDMTTTKQIAANRANAQSSTGPRSLAGKTRSRMNAVQHGLTANQGLRQLDWPSYVAKRENQRGKQSPERDEIPAVGCVAR